MCNNMHGRIVCCVCMKCCGGVASYVCFVFKEHRVRPLTQKLTRLRFIFPRRSSPHQARSGTAHYHKPRLVLSSSSTIITHAVRLHTICVRETESSHNQRINACRLPGDKHSQTEQALELHSVGASYYASANYRLS
jgi:hypothetical protein